VLKFNLFFFNLVIFLRILVIFEERPVATVQAGLCGNEGKEKCF